MPLDALRMNLENISGTYLDNSYMHEPRNLRILLTRRPKAVLKHSQGATKGLRVYKICRLCSACV